MTERHQTREDAVAVARTALVGTMPPGCSFEYLIQLHKEASAWCDQIADEIGNAAEQQLRREAGGAA